MERIWDNGQGRHKMFVKIEGSLVNLDLVYNIDLNEDGTATLWFTGTENASRDITEADLSVIINAIRHECSYEEIEPPTAGNGILCQIADTLEKIEVNNRGR